MYDYKPVSSLWVKLMCNITAMFVVPITGLSFNFGNMHTDAKSALTVFSFAQGLQKVQGCSREYKN